MAATKTDGSPFAHLRTDLGEQSSPVHSAVSKLIIDGLSAPKGANSRKGSEDVKTVYAIAFDLDTNTLQQSYHVASYNNAYYDIRTRLINNHGFAWQQGSVYFGGDTVNAVSCVLAVIDLTNTFSWFAASVRDIRMLRIEEQNDLLPAIQQALATQQGKPPTAP